MGDSCKEITELLKAIRRFVTADYLLISVNERSGSLFIPEGLLANLWEFPSVPSDYDCSSSAELELAKEKCKCFLSNQNTDDVTYVSDVFHQFSHISQTYAVYHNATEECEDGSVIIPVDYQGFKWLDVTEMGSAAISTGMKKVFKAFSSRNNLVSLKRKGKGDHRNETGDRKKQMTLRSFFKPEEL